MDFAGISVRKPVTTIMIYLGMILLGYISWVRLPQELFPAISYPQITVVTSYEGAAPEEMETLVTKIIEEAVGTVNNVKRISSNSKEGLSLVMIEFNWGTNMDFAALSVREKIDLIKERLPREAKEPLVMKYNPFDLPIMTVSITGERPPLEMRRLAKKIVKDELEKIEGVASVEITGGAEREILVEIDQPRLQASGLSILDVVNSLRMANVNYPAGTIKESFYEYLIRTMGEFETIAEIKDVATGVDEPTKEEELSAPQEEREKKERPQRLVYLRDIARIKDTTKEKESISRYNGKENISLTVRKQSGGNTVLVAQGIRKAIARLKGELQGINLDIVYDQSRFIKASISGVTDAAWQGGLLAFIVLYIFLLKLQPSLIITSAIPISVMAVFALMYLCRLTLNTISLGGLALGVGMLVDNAIVVLDTISTKKGDKKQAAIDGTNEVAGAIAGSTLTTVAVFLPTVFVIGIAGQLFKELAFTITFSLLVSLAMALTLVPVFSSMGRGAAEEEKKSPKQGINKTLNALISKFQGLSGYYKNSISFLLEKKVIFLICMLVIFLISLVLLVTTDREFLPRVDQRQFILKVEKLPGTPLIKTDAAVRDIEAIILNLPDVKDVTVNIGSSKDKPAEETLETLGSHQAQILVNLKSRKELNKGFMRSTNDVLQYLKTRIVDKEKQENLAIEYLAQESVLKTAFGQQAPIVLEIKGSNLNKVSEVSKEFKEQLEKVPGIYGVKTSEVLPSPETKVNIIKDRASLYNLSVRDIALTAQAALKGYVATKFKERKEGEEIDMRVRLKESDRKDLANLRSILIHSALRNIEVPLSEVAYLTRGLGPTQIMRLDQQRATVISANIFKRSFNQVRLDVEKLIDKLKSKSGDYTVVFGGQTQAMKESFGSLRFALTLSVVLVYMIMAGEFESLWQPLVIMFTLPLSIIGVAIILRATFTPVSVVALLGLIMLGGIVVNNGIVLIDYTNLLKREGLSSHEALVNASIRRLRPILMTSLTTILGLLPLALNIGEGSELMAPLAITVIGGLISATFLTLGVIPALYLLFEEILSRPIFSFFPSKLFNKIFKRRTEEEAQIPISEVPVFEPAFIEENIIPALDTKEKTIASPEAKDEIPLSEEEYLNERQTRLLELLRDKKSITRAEYARTFNVSIPTAARDLKELMDKGILIARGPLGPGRHYELA